MNPAAPAPSAPTNPSSTHPSSTHPSSTHPAAAPPVHVTGPDGPWEEVSAGLELRGSVVVYATWGEWLTAALADASLRPLLGRDWQRYRRTPDAAVRYRFVTSRMVVKYTAAAALRTEPAALDLSYRIGGRPYIRGMSQIDLSLSHTEDLIAVGISRIGRIGVDVEPAGRRMSYELLKDRVCIPAESVELDRMTPDRQAAEMLRLWTLKEAYTKALGQGLRLGFTEFGFGLADGAFLGPDGSPAAGAGSWWFATHRVLGRYLLSAAWSDTGLDTARDTAVDTMFDEGFMGAVEAELEAG
ncbi:4'-phosphopantetheinyl transferase family protein [Streptomyces sp. NPDC059874]|uniref:4'-phosphopantetheinyl transferase family protein n=1 Tax=Streptomyces sp. NPDC059874 TaxID=3346983 RepID=UPI0036465FFD